MDLRTLGWKDFFQHQLDGLEDPGLCPARVAVEHRQTYELFTADGLTWAELGGRLRHRATSRLDVPAVGDWVAVRDGARVEHVLARASAFVRQTAGARTEPQVVAANVDVVFVVTSANADFNPRRIERYLTAVWDGGASPVIVLNKCDLCADPAALIGELGVAAAGLPVAQVSALDQRGAEQLRAHMGPGVTAALVGSSGVGKSTIVNWLLGRDAQETFDVRRADAKGRHTTTHRELLPLPDGGALIDTPGMRELQLWIEDADLSDTFGDIEAMADRCKFRDCQHDREPGCAVTAAIADGALEPSRWASFRKLQREIEFQSDRRAVKARSRERGKAISRAMRQRRKGPDGGKLHE